MEYVSSRVIPMGWVQAVSLFQHLHRRLGMEPVPRGAGHAEEIEWRRDRPAPQRSDGKTVEFVQFYLDDFDCPEIVASDGWCALQGELSNTHQRQREAYKRWGVDISADKSHVRCPKVVRMGAEVDGLAGTVSAPFQKKMEVAYFALWALSLRLAPIKVILMVLGRLVRCFEFRRPLMSILSTIWPRGGVNMRRPWSASSTQELLFAVVALPLAGSDLRAQVSNRVTCSDASEVGGGLCCSGALTEEGQAVLKQLQSGAYVKTRCIGFQPQGAMPVAQSEGVRIVVISLFDGIAALMCGLCRLKCQVVAFASSEVDKACKRLVRQRWPGVMELGDITKVSLQMLEALAASVGDKVDLVLCGGGSPCQDLSSLLADRAGLQGSRSKLFFEMPRIFDALRACFRCPVFRFVENVFSISAENRDQFSSTLGFQPVLLDSVHFSPCRRPRLFWVDWEVKARGDERLVEHPGYHEWVVQPCGMTGNWWLDDLCTRMSTEPLPTLTRALPRNQPPKQPAGISRASPEAIGRWQADRHRFRVYQYEAEHLVWRPDGTWRLPSLCERERAMGFPVGYVSNALSPKLTWDEGFNVGCCMIGNSFNVYAIALLLDELLASVDASYEPRCLDRIFVKDDTAPPGWCSRPQFDPASQPDECSQMLVQEFLRHGDRSGTDVRLDLGIPFRTKAWPRAGIRSRLFHWRIIHGYPWKFQTHINVLELQAVVNSLQWRLRSLHQFRKRVLHLVDSQVVASIITKGRTSSYRLQKAIAKLASLCVAGRSLQEKVLSPQLHDRYAVAAGRILHFWRECRSFPATWEDMDMATSQWLEHLFAEGYPKGFGSHGLAALQHFLPEVSGKLRHSWRLLKSWHKMEPPVRVLPISPLVVLAMGGACVKMGFPCCAAAFLVAFDVMLRPGELYRIRKKHVSWAGGRAVIALYDTKSGQRKGAEEMVICSSWIANFWLGIALQDKRPNDLLLDRSPEALRVLFFALLELFQDQGVVQPSKRPKLEPKPTEAPAKFDVADAAAVFDSFAFAPAVETPAKHSAFSPHQQLPTSNAVSPQPPGNIYQQQATPQNSLPNQFQQHAVPQMHQQHPQTNQYQQPPGQQQNPPLNQQQATQSPSQYQYQAARQSGQHVPPPNQQAVRPQMSQHVGPPLSSPATGSGGPRVTPQVACKEPGASEQGRASRHLSPGATPQALKNAALLEYDGTFEVELGRDKDGGVFTLLSSKKVGKKVFGEMKRWPGAKAGPRLEFESHVYLDVVERLRDLYGSRSVKTPPEWVLTMLPDFRKHGAAHVSKKVAHVVLADFKAPLLPADACSREGNKVLPYQREAAPHQFPLDVCRKVPLHPRFIYALGVREPWEPGGSKSRGDELAVRRAVTTLPLTLPCRRRLQIGSLYARDQARGAARGHLTKQVDLQVLRCRIGCLVLLSKLWLRPM
eukprot:s88_g43.t1